MLKRFISLLLLLLLLPCAAVMEETEVNTQLTHYLLLGQDGYAEDIVEDARTDTVVIVSLDEKYNRVIMTSVLRDSKIKNPNGNETKANLLYRYYGFDGVIACLERELGIEIKGEVLVNFEHVKPVIDALGGVDIEITEAEYLAIRSILLGKDPNMPKGPGMTHMTGRIALAYMRDRSSGSGDFSRTQRQRNVINELLKKCRSMSLSDLSAVYNTINQAEGIDTDMDALELLTAFQQGYSLLSGEFIENNIPDSHTYSYGTLRGSSVLNVKWDKNRDLLHALLNNPSEEE